MDQGKHKEFQRFCSAGCRDAAARAFKSKKVMAAVCCRDSVSTAFFSQLPGQMFAGVRLSTAFPLDKARDDLTREFLANKELTHMMIIDADVVAAPNLADLLLVDAPLVSAFCWIAGPFRGKFLPMPGIYHWTPSEENVFRTWSMNEVRKKMEAARLEGRPPVVDADLVGGGCWMVDRKTVEALEDPLGSWWRLTWEQGKKIRHGEDVYFYERARDAGLKFKVRLDVECGHMKSVDLRYFAHAVYGMLPPGFYEEIDAKEGGHDDA